MATAAKGTRTSATRREKDTLGEIDVPAEALWGAQTQRGLENYPISFFHPYPAFVRAMVRIKKAEALANADRDASRASRAHEDGLRRARPSRRRVRREGQAVRRRREARSDPPAGRGTRHLRSGDRRLGDARARRIGAAARRPRGALRARH